MTIRRTGEGSEPADSLGTPSQARVAFAMLALGRRQGVTREALADAIWPAGLPPTWGSALRTVVSRVRAFVGGVLGEHADELLVAQGGTYRLRLPDDTAIDVEMAERQIAAARQALAGHRYGEARQAALEATDRLRAPFLPEHDGEWVIAQRERQNEILVVGLEVLSQASRAIGDSGRAVTAALEAVNRAPLRESSHRCLMAAHASAGNRAEALHTYQRLRRLLAEEMGVDPDEQTEAAYLQLLGPTTPSARPTGSRGRYLPPEPAESIAFI
ncbi:MAG: AfsR/SARP family transcriptional regulator, partial [Dehalococcoidia bacterium]